MVKSFYKMTKNQKCFNFKIWKPTWQISQFSESMKSFSSLNFIFFTTRDSSENIFFSTLAFKESLRIFWNDPFDLIKGWLGWKFFEKTEVPWSSSGLSHLKIIKNEENRINFIFLKKINYLIWGSVWIVKACWW